MRKDKDGLPIHAGRVVLFQEELLLVTGFKDGFLIVRKGRVDKPSSVDPKDCTLLPLETTNNDIATQRAYVSSNGYELERKQFVIYASKDQLCWGVIMGLDQEKWAIVQVRPKTLEKINCLGHNASTLFVVKTPIPATVKPRVLELRDKINEGINIEDIYNGYSN